MMDVGGSPPVELRAAVQQHLHQPHHPGIVNLDTGDFGFAGRHRQSHSLKEREGDVNVQGLGFEAGESIRNGDESLAQAAQVLQPFLEAEVFHPIDADFYPQEGAELFVHAANQILAVDAQQVMAMVELFEHTVQLAAQPFADAYSEDVCHFVGGQAEQPHFAGVLKDLVDREVSFENEVPAVFDLVDGVDRKSTRLN